MGLFSRRSANGRTAQPARGLSADAASMRAALTALQIEREQAGGRVGEPDLRDMTRQLLEGEVAAPTADVRWLVQHDTDPDGFYEREVAPSWEGLREDQRASRLEGYLDLVKGLDEAGEDAGLPPEMHASVHTRALLLAWAFDETYGYLARLARGEKGA